jgi:hypothetical protein
MGKIDDDGTMAPLRAMTDGAKQFGLTDAEVLATVDDCVYAVGPDASVADLLDELAGALAHSILAKQRRTLSERDGDASQERRTRSRDPR